MVGDVTSYSFRFNTAYRPSDYVLYLDPDISMRIFSGADTIIFRKNSDLPFSDLFADLFIAVASVTQSGWPLCHTHINTRHRIFGTDLSLSPARIEFSGQLAQNFVGWYWISDRYPRFFEGTRVRPAFPCFDAQSVKNRFTIRIIVPREAPGHPEVADVAEEREGEEGSGGGQGAGQAQERFDQSLSRINALVPPEPGTEVRDTRCPDRLPSSIEGAGGGPSAGDSGYNRPSMRNLLQYLAGMQSFTQL
jgi:hypothetical protein